MSDKVIHLDSSNFDSTVNGGKLVLVDFWAPWCGPCRMLGPTIDAVASEIGDKATVCKVNVDENQGLAQRYSINTIPALLYFKKGQVLNMTGPATKDAILANINKMA